MTTAINGELCGLFEGTTIPASNHFLICFRMIGNASGGMGRSLCTIGPAPGLSSNSSQSSPRQHGGMLGSQLNVASPSMIRSTRSCCCFSENSCNSVDAKYPANLFARSFTTCSVLSGGAFRLHIAITRVRYFSAMMSKTSSHDTILSSADHL